MRGPESRLVDKILEHLRSFGGIWIKIHGGLYQVSGIPDILGCYRGMFFYFEVKTPRAFARKDHDLSERQKRMIARLGENGAVGDVVCEVGQVEGRMHEWR